MTIRRAEKITQLTIRNAGLHYFGFDADGNQVVDAIALSEREALVALVQSNWVRVCALTYKTQKHLCFDCGRLLPLSGHHKKYRSHGRLDVVENVIGICLACHEHRHALHR